MWTLYNLWSLSIYNGPSQVFLHQAKRNNLVGLKGLIVLLIMLKLNARCFLPIVYFFKIHCVPIILISIRFLSSHVHKTWTCGWSDKAIQAEYSIFDFVSKAVVGT